jgi:mRNA-degrading endonuclease RelE of RelBE toxin-antitoxin system
VNKWRVIVDIRRRELVILVLALGRRDEIYS